MKPLRVLLITALFFSLFAQTSFGQQVVTWQSLDKKQQSIVTISALTAKGDLAQLPTALTDGLEAGMTVNEIKEVLVHLAAYCGFPRSLQGINTFIALLDARQAEGKSDRAGREATPVASSVTKYEQGKRALELLTGQPERAPKTGYAAFAPVIDTFLKEHLFADIFGRDILSFSERELATVAALVSMGGVEPMMRSHMGISLRLGISEPALQQLLFLIESKVGKEEAEAGGRVLSAITNSARGQDFAGTQSATLKLFAKGTKAPTTNFTGTVWVNMLSSPGDGLNSSIGVVIFEAGARSAWHKHPGGQILLVTEGEGYYQERGKPIAIMQKGDVVKCLPGVEHWHGASPEIGVTHIAIGPNADRGAAVWLNKVSDKEFRSLE